MRSIKTLLGAGALLWAASLPMYGASIVIAESAFKIDAGLVTSPIDLPGFDEEVTGLGTFELVVSGEGSHNVRVFLDHDIDAGVNTFMNEFGSTSAAAAAAGQSWEIDEPGFVDGDIYDNFVAGALDNSIGVSVYGNTAFPEDVSMALAWAFNLALGETAYLTFNVSESEPAGFYLKQTDPDSPASIYFSSSLTIKPEPTGGLPDGGSTLALLLCAFAGLAGWRSVRKD